MWVLDNISISLQHNGCYWHVCQQDFNYGDIPGWDLVNTTLSFNTIWCDSLNGCLYFNSSPSYNGVTTHQSTSPILDLQVITSVIRY